MVIHKLSTGYPHWCDFSKQRSDGLIQLKKQSYPHNSPPPTTTINIYIYI